VSQVIIIDADPIIYAAGFAAQTSTYEYVLEHPDGRIEQYASESGTEALKYIRASKATVLDKTVHVEAKPEGFARQCAKTQIDSIIRRCGDELGATDPSVEMYLSGPDNFRYKLATIKPYKGDRPPPPVHYQVLRDYLTERWGANVISGMEADDKVSIRGRQLNSDGVPWVLATIDKDLDQVPGLHYDYKNHVFYKVDDEEADLVFWRQCVSGDATDNIQGCYKIGQAGAARMIAEWNEEHDKMSSGPWWLFVWDKIVETYIFNMAKYPDRFPEGMKAEAAALETARLVFMQQYEGQLWNPPGVPHGEVSSLATVR
jgi:hypothetical protein